jgi:hypothetical protein
MSTLAFVVLLAFPALAARHDLVIKNPTAADLAVRVDGVEKGSVAAGGSLELSLTPGKHKVVAWDEVHAEQRVIYKGEVEVEKGERTPSIELTTPKKGLVRVENPSAKAAVLKLEGRKVAELKGGESTLVELPVGVQALQLVADGRTVLEETIDVYAFDESELSARPRLGSVIVHNPEAYTIVIRHGARSEVVEAGRTAVLDDVPMGIQEVMMARTDGTNLGRLQVRVPRGKAVHLELEARAGSMIIPSVSPLRLASPAEAAEGRR